MTRSYACAHPNHVGDRADVHPLDQLPERAEFRRIKDHARVRTVTKGAVCRPCMQREYPSLEPVPTAALWGDSA